MTENRPGIILEETQGTENSVTRTRLKDFPIGPANYTSEVMLGGTGLTRLDTKPLEGEKPHILIEMGEVSACVLVNSDTPRLPLENGGAIIFEASLTQENIARAKKVKSSVSTKRKSWKGFEPDWSGSSMQGFSVR